MEDQLNNQQYNSQSSNDYKLVLLHGWGSNEYDLPGLADVLGTGLEYISLRAPHALPDGYGYAWFVDPIAQRNKREHLAQVAGDYVMEQLQNVLAVDESNRKPKLILLGFSQGATMVVHLLTRSELKQQLAGGIILSGYLPFDGDKFEEGKQIHVPVFHGYGDADLVVPLAESLRLKSWLAKNSNHLVEKCCHGLDHSINVSMAHNVAEFIQQIIKNDNKNAEQ